MLAVLLLRYAKVKQALTVWQEHAASAHFYNHYLQPTLVIVNLSVQAQITVIDKFWD